jgi:hypothetical protein
MTQAPTTDKAARERAGMHRYDFYSFIAQIRDLGYREMIESAPGEPGRWNGFFAVALRPRG